jgi:pyruvate,water dikinase
MIPFVRTIDELDRTKQLLEAEGLKRAEDFKLWMMVEVPSNIFLIEKFLAVGIDGISIGSNDLTQLILGIDRDSEKLASTFDERNEAVLAALERAITVSRKMGVTSSICGQAPSEYPELTEKLVQWGINSVSVSPDMIGTTREIIAKAEAKLKGK